MRSLSELPESGPERPSTTLLSKNACLGFGLAALAVFALVSLYVSQTMGITVDEPLYLASSLVLWEGVSWDHYLLQFHGPVALWPNHLFLSGLAMGDLQADPAAYIGPARLGMLPFGWLGGVLAFWLAWRAFGPSGGLLAVLAYGLHPLVIGYTALCNVDAAHATIVLLVIAAVIAFEKRSSSLRALGVGASLGLLLSTKYLAVLAVPGLATVAVFIALRSGFWRALRSACLALAALSIAMHACYGFRGGLGPPDPGSFETPLLASAAGLPGVGALLALFPNAWLAGLDMVASFQDYEQLTWLAGELQLVHPTYFVRSVWLKSPELWTGLFLLAVAGIPLAVSRKRRGRSGWTLLLLAVATIPPFLYMSFVAEIQSGVRYVHQCLVPWCVWIGSASTLPVWHRLPRRPLAIALLAAVGWQLFDTFRHVYDPLGYFAPTTGGRLASIEVFRDSNNDFGQLHERGREILTTRYGEEVRILEPLDGPGLGRVAAYVADLTPLDPRNPGQTRHWLDALEPVASIGSAWFVYDVRRHGLEQAALLQAQHGDERGWFDLAVAVAASGDTEGARQAMEVLSRAAAEPLEQLLAQLELAERSEGANELELARAWMAVGRADLAVDAMGRSPLGEGPASIARREVLGTAYLIRRQHTEAATVLDVPEVAEALPHLALVAADAWFRAGHVERAIELVEAHRERLPEALRPAADERLEVYRVREQGMAHFGIQPK